MCLATPAPLELVAQERQLQASAYARHVHVHALHHADAARDDRLAVNVYRRWHVELAARRREAARVFPPRAVGQREIVFTARLGARGGRGDYETKCEST